MRTDVCGNVVEASLGDGTLDEDRDTVYQRLFQERLDRMEDDVAPVDYRITERREKPRRFQGD